MSEKKPPSEARIAANRANAQKSTGPNTPDGKQASAQNSFRHGMLARTVVLNGESNDRFLELLQNFMDEFQPATAAETATVETMAIARWRHMRVWSLQKISFDLEMAKQGAPGAPPAVCAALAFRRLSDNGSALTNIHRYETAYDRQFARALRQFHFLQSTRGEVTIDLPLNPTSLAAGTWESVECPESNKIPHEANPENEYPRKATQ